MTTAEKGGEREEELGEKEKEAENVELRLSRRRGSSFPTVSFSFSDFSGFWFDPRGVLEEARRRGVLWSRIEKGRG